MYILLSQKIRSVSSVDRNIDLVTPYGVLFSKNNYDSGMSALKIAS